MNLWSGIGRLTANPELKFTSGSGIARATFTLAIDRNYTDNGGNKTADFIPIVCWRNLAESVANNLTKGRLVGVTGSINTRNYTNDDGKKTYIVEVVADNVQFLDRPKNTNNNTTAVDQDNEAFNTLDDENIPL